VLGLPIFTDARILRRGKRRYVRLPVRFLWGSLVDENEVVEMRDKKLVQYPEDLDINIKDATRDLLAAKSMEDLVEWSGGLYKPPARFMEK
jgi:hypothetical protein